MWAAGVGHTHAVEALIGCGADINTQNRVSGSILRCTLLVCFSVHECAPLPLPHAPCYIFDWLYMLCH